MQLTGLSDGTGCWPTCDSQASRDSLIDRSSRVLSRRPRALMSTPSYSLQPRTT